MQSTKRVRKATLAALSVVVLASCFTVGCESVAGNGIDQSAVDRATAFLSKPEVGKEVITYMHMGADYQGHAYMKTLILPGPDGNAVPGEFALAYHFEWSRDGFTDLAFLCDPRGRVYAVRVLKSNGILNQPFLFANVSVQLLGDALIAIFHEKLDSNQLQAVQKFVDEADVKGLLALSLSLKQSA